MAWLNGLFWSTVRSCLTIEVVVIVLIEHCATAAPCRSLAWSSATRGTGGESEGKRGVAVVETQGR